MSLRPPASVLAALLLIGSSTFALAQQSRADVLRAERAKKAQNVAPYKAGKIEKLALLTAQRESGGKPLGFYPYFGSIQQGGLVAAGIGYRYPFMDTGRLSVEVAGTPRLYWKVDGKLRVPLAAHGRVRFDGRALILDAPKAPFYGIGNDTPEERSNFRTTPTTLDAVVSAQPADWITVGGGLAYLNMNTGSGKGSDPSVDEVYAPGSLPGLGSDPTYLVPRVFAELDWRDSDGYATRGGRLLADWQEFSERDDLQLSFRRLEFEASHFVPILRDNWVIGLRAELVTTSTSGDNEVPFFLMPTLGGSRNLRGFTTFRFRDRNSLVLTAEYRWTPSRVLDMVLFYDVGKVAPELEDLDFDDMHDSYGIGGRLHTSDATLIRLELARSVEGLRFIFGVGANF